MKYSCSISKLLFWTFLSNSWWWTRHTDWRTKMRKSSIHWNSCPVKECYCWQELQFKTIQDNYGHYSITSILKSSLHIKCSKESLVIFLIMNRWRNSTEFLSHTCWEEWKKTWNRASLPSWKPSSMWKWPTSKRQFTELCTRRTRTCWLKVFHLQGQVPAIQIWTICRSSWESAATTPAWSRNSNTIYWKTAKPTMTVLRRWLMPVGKWCSSPNY